MRIKTNKIVSFILAGLAIFLSFNSFSQKLVAQVSKNKVVTGEVFQVSFTVNGNMTGFKPPAFTDFDVYSGPNQSTSMQIANSNMSQTVSYSYMIAARKEGKLVIGTASATINGAKSESNPIAIEAGKDNPQQQQQSQNSAGGNTNQAQQNVNSEDLFVRSYLSKKQCYLGEQIVITQKVYCRITLRGFQNANMPEYNGFWSKDEERKGQIQLTQENLDGINYNVAEFSKTYLFPQRGGKLTIDPIEIDCIVRQQKKQQTIFDQFFGGGGQDVAVKIKSKPVSVDVIALPEKGKPENFTGAVGNFS
ncbi:MAG TPA: BatD family protein, partial [Bacteroidia bacterium]